MPHDASHGRVLCPCPDCHSSQATIRIAGLCPVLLTVCVPNPKAPSQQTQPSGDDPAKSSKLQHLLLPATEDVGVLQAAPPWPNEICHAGPTPCSCHCRCCWLSACTGACKHQTTGPTAEAAAAASKHTRARPWHQLHAQHKHISTCCSRARTQKKKPSGASTSVACKAPVTPSKSAHTREERRPTHTHENCAPHVLWHTVRPVSCCCLTDQPYSKRKHASQTASLAMAMADAQSVCSPLVSLQPAHQTHPSSSDGWDRPQESVRPLLSRLLLNRQLLNRLLLSRLLSPRTRREHAQRGCCCPLSKHERATRGRSELLGVSAALTHMHVFALKVCGARVKPAAASTQEQTTGASTWGRGRR